MTRVRLTLVFALLLGGVAALQFSPKAKRRPSSVVARLSDRRCRAGCSGRLFAGFSLAGPWAPAQGITNTIPTGSAFCISAYLNAPAGGWESGAGVQGIAHFGSTFGVANSISMYRSAGVTGGSVWFRLWDSTGSGHDLATSNPNSLKNTRQKVTGCYTPTGGTSLWIDGVKVGGAANGAFPFAQPATMRIGDLASLNSPYATGLMDTLCVDGPTGVTSTDPTLAVKNTCGWATVVNTGPCYGCITPNANGTKVLTVGDSITSGDLVYRPYPSKLNALLGATYNVTNAGQAGGDVSAMKSNYETKYRSAGISRCIFLGGINDIMSQGATASATYATASALLDEMRADGCRPIVALPTPAKNASIGWTSARQTEYDSYRSSLSSYCTANSSTTTCINTYTSLGDGTTPPQLASSMDSGDHTHPSQLGEDTLANAIYTGASWP